jgi:hypothetical protein
MLAYPTSIVILQGWDRVYVGADSRRVYRIGNKSYAGSVCKISRAGKWYFVASGLTYANDQQVSEIGIASGQKARSTSQAAETFRKRMRDFLPGALTAERDIDRSEDTAAKTETVLEAAFIGVESDGAKVSVEWYRRDTRSRTDKIVSDRRTYSLPAPGSTFDVITLGRAHAIDERLASRSVQVKSDADAIATLNKLIGFEITDSPKTTAGPVDVLKIDGSGSSWLRSKPACSAPSY